MQLVPSRRAAGFVTSLASLGRRSRARTDAATPLPREEVVRLLEAHRASETVPEPPDFSLLVRRQLECEQRQRHRLRPALQAGAVALAAAALAVAVVPQARTATLRFLGIGGVRIERIDHLPQVSRRPPSLGRRTTFEAAARRVSFHVLLPDGRAPDSVFYAPDPPGGRVTLVYGDVARPRLLVTEFEGSHLGPEILKRAPYRVPVERVRVGGYGGIWVGGRHSFAFLDTRGMTRGEDTRLAGRTLAWQRGPLTLRVEGGFDKDGAIDLARTFH